MGQSQSPLRIGSDRWSPVTATLLLKSRSHPSSERGLHYLYPFMLFANLGNPNPPNAISWPSILSVSWSAGLMFKLESVDKRGKISHSLFFLTGSYMHHKETQHFDQVGLRQMRYTHENVNICSSFGAPITFIFIYRCCAWHFFFY